MNIRRDPIYISYDVWRALWLLSKSRSTEGKTITPDEMVDQILRQFIEKQFPQLIEHQKELDKLERKLIESLTK